MRALRRAFRQRPKLINVLLMRSAQGLVLGRIPVAPRLPVVMAVVVEIDHRRSQELISRRHDDSPGIEPIEVVHRAY